MSLRPLSTGEFSVPPSPLSPLHIPLQQTPQYHPCQVCPLHAIFQGTPGNPPGNTGVILIHTGIFRDWPELLLLPALTIIIF